MIWMSVVLHVLYSRLPTHLSMAGVSIYLRVRVPQLNHQLRYQGHGSTVELHTETQNQTPDISFQMPKNNLVSLFLMSALEERSLLCCSLRFLPLFSH